MSLDTTNPNTYVKFIFLRTSPLSVRSKGKKGQWKVKLWWKWKKIAKRPSRESNLVPSVSTGDALPGQTTSPASLFDNFLHSAFTSHHRHHTSTLIGDFFLRMYHTGWTVASSSLRQH